MHPSHIEHDHFAFDEVDSLRRRARNRAMALARVKARKRHLGPRDEDDFDDDDWDDADDDDYSEDEWDSYD